MRALILFCRLVVGSLFIVSGLIKANDPLGFSYKLEEYFAESALNLPAFEPWALFFAILVCTAEVVLGFAILFGGRMKVATIAILVLTLFFGWLTAYTATCDPQDTYTVIENGEEVTRTVTCVTDCGCFGDAMKGSIGRSLTPWESFSKDAILFVFLIPVLLAAFLRKDTAWNTGADDKVLLPGGLLLVGVWCWIFTWWGPFWFTLVGYAGYLLIKRKVQGTKAEWFTATWAAVITLLFIYWCYAHLPVRDYRPYAVGNNIRELKKKKDPVTKVFLSYKNTATGEVKEYDTNGNYPWNDSTYVLEENSNRVEILDPGIKSPVEDFHLTDRDGYELTDDILNEPTPVLLVLIHNVEKADLGCMPTISKLAQDAQAKGWYVYGMTANGWDAIEEFRHTHQLAFDFTQGDDKVIKTVIRANPGVMLLKQGAVMGLWHCNDVPSFEEAEAKVK